MYEILGDFFLCVHSQIIDKPFFMWISSNLSRYHSNTNIPDFPFSVDVLYSLPIDRVSYVSLEETFHTFSASIMIIPKSLIPLMDHLFCLEYDHMRIEFADWHCGMEEWIWTRIKNKYPELFHIMSYEKENIDFLWGHDGDLCFQNRLIII